MLKCYKRNHDIKYIFTEPIQEFSKLKTYPKELYNLDILDGSPPLFFFFNGR